jgi:hypothetical protein
LGRADPADGGRGVVRVLTCAHILIVAAYE